MHSMTTQKSINTTAKPKTKGFTLIELLVALVIVSISFMAILPLLWNTMNVNKTTDLGVKARDYATQKVEDLMSRSRGEIDPLVDNTDREFKSSGEYLSLKGDVLTSITDPNKVFTRTWGIKEVPGVTVDPKPVIFTCVVSYTYKGQTRTRSFSTLWSF